jgi:hypothetical protein
MDTMRQFVGVVLSCFERFRGPKTVYELERARNCMGGLRGFTVRGYEIVIYCQRKEYQVKYDRWYIPDRIESTYKMFSVVTNDAPEALKRACELEVELPGLIHSWNFDRKICRAQVHAYLDLLEMRIKNEVTS